MPSEQVSFVVSFSAVLGKIIALGRAAVGLKQGQLGEEAGLKQASYSRIERGAADMSVGQLVSLAAVLGVKPHELLLEAEQAAEHLRKHGVEVLSTRADTEDKLVLEGVALERLVAQALDLGADEDEEQD